jgi:hypothetical protein
MTQPIYEVVTSFDEQKVIKRTNEDGTLSFIPMDESNSDYQAYLNKDKPVEHFTPILPE